MRQSALLCRPAVSTLLAAGILLATSAPHATARSSPSAPPPGAAAVGSPVGSAASAASAADLNGQVPVIRRGRYTLVELVPAPAQRDLMRQVVDVSIPPAFDASVGDALQHVLLRSGYRLCATPDTAALVALPLPAAHLQLGPLTLRDALLTLAGPAWDLSVDDGTREVCFQRHGQDRMASPATASAPTASAAPSTSSAGREVQR